jgi:pimeloyl-ACP methyl ester carboxylesterase
MTLLLLACAGSTYTTPSDEDHRPRETGAVDTADEAEDTGFHADTGERQDTEDPRDYRQTGPVSVSTQNGSRTTATGCELGYRVVSGSSPVADVVLAHGFMRSGDQMMGWAEHLASWGLRVTVPDLCWSGAFNADPAKNALDLEELVSGPVALVGHSAGGLAVLLAAQGVEVTALVGLDPVEQFGQDNSGAASGVGAPTLALFGEPGSCNSDNSGVGFYGAVPSAMLLDLAGADHCDFESPSDATCEAFCSAAGGDWSDDDRREALRGAMTAWVLQDEVDSHLASELLTVR